MPYMKNCQSEALERYCTYAPILVGGAWLIGKNVMVPPTHAQAS